MTGGPLPEEVGWVAVMDRVGGNFLSYQALLADARAYDDVLAYMAAETEAAKIRAMKRGQD